MRRLTSLAVMALVLLPCGGVASAQDDPALVELGVDGSPLVSGGDGRIAITAVLAEAAELRLRVLDFDGRPVRELYRGRRGVGSLTRGWRGRDEAGAPVPNGPYRIRAAASTEGGATERAEAWVTVAERAIYPQRPGFITVAVDPGHGGRLSGAKGSDGTREADLNLDIGLRLARMLEAAGVNVAITRTTDAFVNTPAVERTGNGVIDDDDELAARPDVANLARADLFISIHNNEAVNESVGGPSTFYFDERPFGGRNERLARIVQEEMVAALDEAGPDGWVPYDHGALIYPYYVLRGYHPPRLNRPTQMPGVLSEGLFLSNERELRLLQRPAVRAAMASAYYQAIARYLAWRPTHVGYALAEAGTAPEEHLTSGQTRTYAVEVRNGGQEAMRGWKLRASAIAAPASDYSRSRKGQRVGQARIPRLEPGQSAVVEVEVTAPAPGREWMLLFDAVDREGRRAASIGSPMLQVRLTTIEPPEPSPDPAAAAEGSPAP